MASVQDSQAALEAAIAAAERKRSQGDLAGAYADYQAIAAARMGSDYSAADLFIQQSLADLATLFGDFEAADDILVSLVGLGQQAHNWHRADYGTLKRIHLALDRGHLRQAQALFQSLEARIGDIKTLSITPEGLQAWEARCRWPNTDRADRTVLFATLYLEMGRLLTALGQYCDALEVLNRGLTHATPGDSQSSPALARQRVPWLQLAIARACLESGMLPETEAVLTALQGFLGSLQARSLQIHWHTLMGQLTLLRGQFGEAQDHFRVILQLCRQLKSPRGAAISTLNLAQVLIVLNQNRLAAEYLSSITAEVALLHDPHLKARQGLLQRLAQARSQSLVAGSTVSVSDLLQDEAAPASQPQTADDSFTFERTQSPNYLTLFEDRVLELQWYLSQSNVSGAAAMLAHMQMAFARTDSQLILTKIKTLQGMVAYYQGIHQIQAGDLDRGQQQLQWAAVTLDEARSRLVRLGLKPEQWQVQRLLGWCLMRLESPAADQELLATDTNQLLTDLTATLSPEQQVLFLLNKWTADEEYIATQITRLRQLQQRRSQAPWHQRLRLRWQTWQQLNNLINHIDHYRRILSQRTLQGQVPKPEPQSKSTPSLWSRLWQHPWQGATLSFLVLPDQIFVVRSGWFWLDFAIVPLTRLELRNLVSQWYECLEGRPRRSINREPVMAVAQSLASLSRDLTLVPDDGEGIAVELVATPESIAQALATQLNLAEMLRLPRYIRNLTLVPDDVLHIFPFAAFQHQGEYLIKTFSLNIAYDTAAHVKLMTSSPPTLPSPTYPLLVGISQGGPQLVSLPGVSREIAAVSTKLSQQGWNPQVLQDGAVNKATLLTHLPTSSLLHMACHGVFYHNRADRSGLVLDPQSDPLEVLSLQEIAALNLQGLRHVTLSACSSADHLVLPGRWVISLPETLWRSGVQSILGSLWQVYDEFAIAFMTQFYTYLQTLPRDEALRQTQLDCLHQQLSSQSNLDTTDPKYWAGFNLYGQIKGTVYRGHCRLRELECRYSKPLSPMNCIH